MDVVIRSIAEADFAAWLPLWDGYNAFYGRSGTTALPADISRSTWQRCLDHREPVHALVAEVDGRIVGLAHYLFHRTTTAIADTCYLQDLYSDAAVRGRGVATALVEAVRDRARAAGAARLYWQTHETNAAARRLYDRIAERSGFIVYRMAVDPPSR
jgi:GNAT superfamily N-acetyltransferase